MNKLTTIYGKPYSEQYIHFNKLLLTINATLQETAVLTALVPLLYKVSIFNLEYNNTDAQHISKIITNCYIPYLLSSTHNELAYLLQDLCFKIQYPEERNRIVYYMNWLYPDIDNIIHNIEQQFRNIFSAINIKANLSYRIKSPYSIWVKTLVKDIHITALNDILAFRAIVPNKKACYDVSKLIHLHYNTITSQFVDYIRYPKNNGYQSIHIVISGSNKGNIELQIRSTTMHRQTQYGSAHHTYKANKYYVSRTNNNVSVILCNITLSYSNRILNVDISIVTITSQIINNVSAYNTFAAFTNTQHSTHFVVNNTLRPPPAKTDVMPKAYNTSFAIINNKVDIEKYAQKEIMSYTNTYNTRHLLELLIAPELLRHNISYISDHNKNILLYHAPNFDNSELVPFLIEHGADINAKTTNNATVLHSVSESGNISLVDWLVTNGAEVDVKDNHHNNALYYAYISGNFSLIQLLVEHGADVNAKINDNHTILHYAAISDNFSLVQFLVEHSADVNAKTDSGETVLHFAVQSGNVDLVDWLIQQGADVNAKTTDNKTLLHYALEYKYFNIVKILIQCGIDLESATYNSMCHNDVFNYIKYTNTIPKQSTFEDIQTCQVQQYKRNTSANLKTDEILNPAPESLDIQNNSNNLRSNTCMDITPLSLNQIECHITAIPKSIDDTERPLHTLEQKVQFYTGKPCHYRYYEGYYQLGSMEYNSYRYQDAILYYDSSINIINNTNYEEYDDEEKCYIIESLGNIYVDKGNALCMQHKYDEGTVQYNYALLTYNKLQNLRYE